MAAFTRIVPGVSWQDEDIFNEIVAAASERIRATSTTASLFNLRAFGDRVRTPGGSLPTATVAALQASLESVATQYVDHNLAASGSFEGQASLPLYTQLAWYQAAGMSSGFRRATSWNVATSDWTNYTDPMYSYGPAVAGDIDGPWTRVDLQRAELALRWTLRSASVTGTYREVATSNSVVIGVCATARQTALDTWTASWSPEVTGPEGYVARSEHDDGLEVWSAVRYRNKFQASGIATHVPHTAHLYGLMQADRGTFKDIDSLGAVEGTYHLWEDVASSSSAAHVSAHLGDFSGCPIALPAGSPHVCGDTTLGYGIRCRSGYWLLKWAFSVDSIA